MSSLFRLLVVSLAACAALGATCGNSSNTDLTAPTKEALRPVLGAGDVIEIRVFNEKELSGEHRVSDEGTVRLPLVGSQTVEGFSPEDAAAKIAKAYDKEYLRNAQVMVIVKEFNSRKVFVLGQVKKPGSYPFEDRMTVIAAIARAGGTAKLADLNGTILTRSTGAETDDVTRTRIAVGDIRRGDKPDIAVKPGDIIFVPESPF